MVLLYKRARVVSSEQFLGMIQRNWKKFLWRYVTKNQEWLAGEKRVLYSLRMSSVLFDSLFSYLVVIPGFE